MAASRGIADSHPENGSPVSAFTVYENAAGSHLWLDKDQAWPTTYDCRDAVRVTLTAGYGDNMADVPEDIRLAISHTAAHWFHIRKPVGNGRLSEIPVTADALLENYRRRMF